MSKLYLLAVSVLALMGASGAFLALKAIGTKSAASWTQVDVVKPPIDAPSMGTVGHGRRPNVSLQCYYSKVIIEGDDLVVGVAVSATVRGVLQLTVQSTSSSVRPEKLEIPVVPDEPAYQQFVVLGNLPGQRHVLLHGIFVEPPAKPQDSHVPTLPRFTVANQPIAFQVRPRSVFGIADTHWKVIQIISGVLGIPAFLAFVGSLIRPSATKTQNTSEPLAPQKNTKRKR